MAVQAESPSRGRCNCSPAERALASEAGVNRIPADSLEQQAPVLRDLRRRLGFGKSVGRQGKARGRSVVELAFDRLPCERRTLLRRRGAAAESFELLSCRRQIVLQLADLTLGLFELTGHGLLELQVLGM